MSKVNKDSVFVEVETAPQQFKKRLVKTGPSSGINAEITSGLAKADKVKGLGPLAVSRKAKGRAISNSLIIKF